MSRDLLVQVAYLVTKQQLVNILFELEIHTYHGSPKISTGNSWSFPELLPNFLVCEVWEKSEIHFAKLKLKLLLNE